MRHAGRAALLAATVALAGCAQVTESRFNPFNWVFGGEGRAAPPTARADTRPLVPLLTEVRVERTAGGAVIRATGLAGRQGWFGAELVPVAAGPGVLAYRFVAEAPEGPTPTGTPRTRTLTAADWKSDVALTNVLEIRVFAAQNALSTRR